MTIGLSLLLSLAISLASFIFLSPSAFNNASGGLLTLFSILGGLVAQSMVFTAMLVSPEKLPPDKMAALKQALFRQQKFWLRQFQAYMVVCASIVVWSIMINQWENLITNCLFGRVVMSLNVLFVSYAIISSFHFPARVMSLQRLRFDVMEDERKSR
ncbi:hypothetical protein [Azospirillum argentinense]|uniref:hypothetical protein n=1 Tax=Azospirillum argentinense TaxID=2970906 RepID=UPI0032E00027